MQQSVFGIGAACTFLLGSAGAAVASPTGIDGPSVRLSDGTLVRSGEEIAFSFQGAPPAPDKAPQACPEVNDPPTLVVTGTPRFIEDKSKPQSTWLLPRQSVSWAVSGAHTFNAEVVVGGESEVGAIIAKAKVKIDVKIGKTWTWNSTQTVTDTNSTKSGYRAVLGAVGWRLTTKKTWIVPPCAVRTSTIVVDAPRAGDLSIGRSNR
jgi:hypothetical protein